MRGGFWLTMFFVAVFTGTAQADSDYRCTIGRVSLAQGDTGHIYELYKGNYVGKEFVVERASGLMSGVLNNSSGSKPQVIDTGSKSNSYKVISSMHAGAGPGATSGIYALTILEYKKGAKKPFIYLHTDMVFFGECGHF